jgi:hypothetical protein
MTGLGQRKIIADWQLWVGCCRLHFQIAVIDFDAVMTGN